MSKKDSFHLINPYQFVFLMYILNRFSFFLLLPIGLFHFIILQTSLSVSQFVSQSVDKIVSETFSQSVSQLVT